MLMADKIKNAFGGWFDILLKLLVTTMVTAIFIRTYEVPEIRVKIEALESKIEDKEAEHKELHKKYESEFDEIKKLIYQPHETFRRREQSYIVPDSTMAKIGAFAPIESRERHYLSNHN